MLKGIWLTRSLRRQHGVLDRVFSADIDYDFYTN